jgi:hypothetical protein
MGNVVDIVRTSTTLPRVYKHKVSQEDVRLGRRPQLPKLEELENLVAGIHGRTSFLPLLFTLQGEIGH